MATVSAVISFEIEVQGGILVTSPPPPSVVGAGQNYTHTFAVAGVGSQPPFVWTATEPLPSWLTLTPNADGSQAVLAGTAPAVQGTYPVRLRVDPA